MHMQCKETHKCSQNRISRVRVKLSKLPSRVARNCSTSAGDLECYSSDSILCRGSKSEPKSPNPANRFEEKQIFEKVVPNMDCFARLQSRHLNIFQWGNLGNPDSVPKATCPSSPNVLARELGYDRGRSAVSTPFRPVRRPTSTNRDIRF